MLLTDLIIYIFLLIVIGVTIIIIALTLLFILLLILLLFYKLLLKIFSSRTISKIKTIKYLILYKLLSMLLYLLILIDNLIDLGNFYAKFKYRLNNIFNIATEIEHPIVNHTKILVESSRD